MKRKTKNLLVLLAALFLLSGCTPRTGPATQPSGTALSPSITTTAPATEPVQTTEQTESTTTPEEPSIYKAPPEGSVPILLYTAQGEKESVANYLTWDVKNGTFSEPVPGYTVGQGTNLSLWNGGPFVVISGTATDRAPGIQTLKEETEHLHIVYGSFCDVGSSDHFVMYNMDGSKVDYDKPLINVPTDVFDRNLPTELYYATVDKNTMIAAYSVYDFDTMEGDMVYVTYPVDDPDAAVWNVAHIPFDYAVDVDANWNGAYWDGVLYMAAMETVLALDLETGELKALEAFEQVHALTPEATQYGIDTTMTIRLAGCWDGILVASYPQYMPDGTLHNCYVALQDGKLAGMVVKTEDRFTFYDSRLQVIGMEEGYVGKLAPVSSPIFAKQS